jgi:threonine aldolase
MFCFCLKKVGCFRVEAVAGAATKFVPGVGTMRKSTGNYTGNLLKVPEI